MRVTNIENQSVKVKKKIEKILEEKQDCEGLCPIHDFLTRFGDKWSMLILLNLGRAGQPRFNALKKMTTGISQRMLTVTLRSLERDGLVTRELFPEIPPRVEYQLTPLGNSLLSVIMQLGDWASQHHEKINQARKVFDKKH